MQGQVVPLRRFDGELTPENLRLLTEQIRDLEDRCEGYRKTVDKQSREIGALTRRVAEDEDPKSHPKGAEIVAVIERWKVGTGHAKAKISADRVKLVKARIRDDYPITLEDSEEPAPTIELAVDGIAAYPFVVNGQRVPRGKSSQRHDGLSIALAGGEKLERFARLGYQARRQGWTPAGGWPEQRGSK